MDSNHEANVNRWVDDQMGRLGSESDWRPNVARALASFDQQRRAENDRRRKWVWTVASTVAACLCVLAFPASRNAARHLWHSSYLRTVNIGHVSAAAATLKYGEAPPDFTLQSASGDNIRLSAYRGQVVLLNFWATWCGVCTTEIPSLIEFQEKYRSKGLVVIGVSIDDDGWKSVSPFIAENKVNYPVVIGNGEMAKQYGLEGMPMTYLIDREGKIAATSIGLVDKDSCEREINQLLAN